MKIDRIKLENYKNFLDIEIDCNQMNVILGGNSTGKTNFVSIFSFLKDLSRSGIDQAIHNNGGLDYLVNVKSKTKKCTIGLSAVYGGSVTFRKTGKFVNIRCKEFEYEITFSLLKGEVRILAEKLLMQCEFGYIKDKGQFISFDVIKPVAGILSYKRKKDRIQVEMTVDDEETIDYQDFLDLKEIHIQNESMLNTLRTGIRIPLDYFFENLVIYDLDLEKMKFLAMKSKRPILKGDGSNFSSVLLSILDNRENRRKFVKILRSLLPYIDDVKASQFIEDMKMIENKEIYSTKYFPISHFSDGTLRIMGLITILFFNYHGNVIILEEPTRNIHPKLIGKLMELVKDASYQKQIIITTHNPQVLSNIDIDDILLVDRANDGNSILKRLIPDKQLDEELRILGITDVYIHGNLK